MTEDGNVSATTHRAQRRRDARVALRRGLWDGGGRAFSDHHSGRHIGQGSSQSSNRLHTSLPPSLPLWVAALECCPACRSFLEHSRAFLSSLSLHTEGGRETQSPRGIADQCLRTPRAMGCLVSCLSGAGSDLASASFFFSLLLAGPRRDQVQGTGRELPQACCAL